MHRDDSPERRSDPDDPSFPQPKRPLVIHADAVDADWIKPDVRLADDGAIYVRDLSVPGGTRRVEPGTAEHGELRGRLGREPSADQMNDNKEES
jgi:hypothetical protein